MKAERNICTGIFFEIDNSDYRIEGLEAIQKENPIWSCFYLLNVCWTDQTFRDNCIFEKKTRFEKEISEIFLAYESILIFFFVNRINEHQNGQHLQGIGWLGTKCEITNVFNFV